MEVLKVVYYLEYVNSEEYLYITKVKKERAKKLCNSIIKDGGHIVRLYYIENIGLEYIHKEINYINL